MTRTTTVLWPEDLLGCPLRSTYQATIAPMFGRTTISEAPPAFVRFKVDESRGYTLSFLWTMQQLYVFQDWFTNTINSGLKMFMMSHLTSGILEPLMCQIATAYSVAPQADHVDLVRVEFDVVAYWRVAQSPNWGI